MLLNILVPLLSTLARVEKRDTILILEIRKLRFCISKKLLANAQAAGTQTLFWVTRELSSHRIRRRESSFHPIIQVFGTILPMPWYYFLCKWEEEGLLSLFCLIQEWLRTNRERREKLLSTILNYLSWELCCGFHNTHRVSCSYLTIHKSCLKKQWYRMTCSPTHTPKSGQTAFTNRQPRLPSPIKNITVSSRQYHISQENQLLSHPFRALETRRTSRTFPALQPGPRDNKEVSLPNLAVGGRCLCDDRAGLGWRHGLLNHNTGVMVGHPCAAKLVSSRPRHGPTNCIMHRDILPREDRGERSEEANVLSYFQALKDQNWESGYVN